MKGLRSMRLAALGCSFVLGAGAAEASPAGEDQAASQAELSPARRAEARARFLAGVEAFDDADYDEAIGEFEAAFAIVRSPELVYNIGRCHEELGERNEAIYHYEMYLRLYPDEPDTDDVESRIGRLEGEKTTTRPQRKGDDDEAKQEGDEADDSGFDPEGFFDDEIWSTVRLVINTGFLAPISSKWDQGLLPLEAGVFFPLHEWFSAGVMARLAFNVAADEKTGATGFQDDAKLLFGLVGGFRGLWKLHPRIALTGLLGVELAGITRAHNEHKDPVFYLPGEIHFGTVVWITGGWHINLEFVADIGMVVTQATSVSPDVWGGEKVQFAADLGGRLGVEYAF